MQTSLESQKEKTGIEEHNLLNIKPTSSEVGSLWSSYLAENMSVAMLNYMVAKSKEKEIHGILELALNFSKHRVDAMTKIFDSISYSLPDGFNEKDVDVNAPELFSEVFSLKYTRIMTKFILQNYSIAFSESSRKDFKNLFSECINTSKDLIDKANDTLLIKGLFPKSPYITKPDVVKYVHSKKYFGSLLGSERPLNVFEVSNIFNIMDLKMSIRALKLGFAQVVKSDSVRSFFNRGLHMSEKQLKVLNSFLENEGLPGPELLNYQVTNSKTAPYSDRLMMFHVTTTMGYIMSAYGLALTNTLRKDVLLAFSRLMAGIGNFVKDGVDLLIENGWLEELPEAADRHALTH